MKFKEIWKTRDDIEEFASKTGWKSEYELNHVPMFFEI